MEEETWPRTRNVWSPAWYSTAGASPGFFETGCPLASEAFGPSTRTGSTNLPSARRAPERVLHEDRSGRRPDSGRNQPDAHEGDGKDERDSPVRRVHGQPPRGGPGVIRPLLPGLPAQRIIPARPFQTSPYACKRYQPGSVRIKRRKRSWLANVEGRVEEPAVALLRELFSHMVFSRIPATTSPGIIGAVFHPTTYLLNLPTIREAERASRAYSFYIEGIAQNPVVGPVVEEVDQIRLRIADAFGCSVFGLRERPRKEEWAALMDRVHEFEDHSLPDRKEHRRRRAALLQPIHDAVVSGQHWLAYTYGVQRVPGESLPSAIGRTLKAASRD